MRSKETNISEIINISSFFYSYYAILKIKNPKSFKYFYECETNIDFNGNYDVICNGSESDDLILANRNEEATFECFAHDESSLVNQRISSCVTCL